MEKKFTFRKRERLTSEKEIDQVFSKGKNHLVYPLRFSYLEREDEAGIPVKILTGVAKKKIRKAVNRNLIKRRIREAYRLNKHGLSEALQNNNKRLSLAVVYIGNDIEPFRVIEKSLIKGLHEISIKMAGQHT